METAESIQLPAGGFRSSSLKKPAALTAGGCRLAVSADGSVCSLDSLSEGRSLFGRGQLFFYKIQAGVVVPALRTDWWVRLSPRSAGLSARVFEHVDVTQSVELVAGPSPGYVRRVRLHNAGSQRLDVRVVSLSDPTGAHFPRAQGSWGSLGMEAFNRGDHVAMDEISDPQLARVVGAAPAPVRFYMTTDSKRATELLQEGALPEQTAGMSGQVLVLSVHELQIPPGESAQLTFASVYSAGKLEGAVSAFESVRGHGPPQPPGGGEFACSSPGVSEAFGWALAAVQNVRYDPDLLDRLESLPGLEYADPKAAESVLEGLKGRVGRSGLLPMAQDPDRQGVLESSLFVSALSRHLAVAGDRKAARRPYSLLRKVASAVSMRAKDGALPLEGGPPQGWRRQVKSGNPAGEVSEVSLAAAAALHDIGLVSPLLGKGEDGAAFREKAELIVEGVARRMRDGRGLLCLGSDVFGKPRRDETVDMAVACYRNQSLRSAASSAVHRLLEDDFDTEYGPRTVPTSNRTYFHDSYGQGQLGGYWTRAALAAACLSYGVALPGVGSLLLEKVSGLVTEDALKLGGAPGEFPYWVDVDAKEAHGAQSDPVAASRFIQAVVEGELGFELARGIPFFDPPALSTVSWLMACGIRAGEPVSIFVGRGAGRAVAFAACRRAELKAGMKFESAEVVRPSVEEVSCVSFHGPGQVVCVGNASQSPVAPRLTVSPRSQGLSKRLSTPLEEYNPADGSWSKVGSLRVSAEMAFDAQLGPREWKAFRISND